MKKCNSCGALVADDSRFCSECGSSDIISLPSEAPVQSPVQPPVNEPAPAAPAAAPSYAQPASQPAQPYEQPAQQPAPQYAQPAAPQPTPQPAPQQPNNTAGGYPPAAPANNGTQDYYRQAQTPSGNAPAGGYYTGGNVPPAGGSVPPAGAAYQQPGAYPYAAGQQNYASAPPVKKKKKTGLIIAIVLGVLFIFGAIVLFIGARIAKKALEDMDPNAYIDELISEFESGLIDETSPAVPYTKGELSGDVYTNEWAGLQFTIPEGFVNGSEEDYDDSSDIYTDACLIAEDEDNGISFITIGSGGYTGMTEDDYLKYLTDDMLDEEMISQGWSFGTNYSMQIAGEDYRAIKMSNSYTDSFEEIVACRIYDDHMLCFICYGDTTVIDGFFDSITTP